MKIDFHFHHPFFPVRRQGASVERRTGLDPFDGSPLLPRFPAVELVFFDRVSKNVDGRVNR
jgi:hypothetical protein